jgi:hypothetical protein
MAIMLTSSGITGSFVFVAAVACLGAVAVAVLGQETKGKILEERIAGEHVLAGSASASL